ncbi:hydantoinase/oxoprolinase family protein [Agrobacterium vitis]|uniref:hydantoinase/oxoprolinase family protein n=1 Tax=Agrobacterium vitis TaxID=373 RepID=UPI0012E8F5BF|nr:hydantoinase/oxoprolinase family protein [Agrobacterium vitis]MUZ65373.1 hydantoinase/oxoprolinase family protein [Agrobacterium vitis]
MYRIGIDVGGTFTDFVMLNAKTETVVYYKRPSTPHDPSEAIANGMSEMIALNGVDAAQIEFVGHGTTVATNMIIERRGVATGLLTTKGFRDVLAIGRQSRPGLYDYRVRKVEPLVPRRHRMEVDERMAANGEILIDIDEDRLVADARSLWADGVRSIAICFLHSYRNPFHEQRAKAAVLKALPDAYVSISSEVLPEFREFERTSTTVLNAYVGPKMQSYTRKLRDRLREILIPVEPMTVHSNGGLLSLQTVEDLPVLTCLSGPAAGVIGAAALGMASGYPNLITYDVGGTSTDVSLIADGQPKYTSKREITQFPLKTPMVDIQVIGAGGGSIAWIDDTGALKVGPHSAGAFPGPVAYGNGGEEPTLTDVNICMQRLNPVALLNGRMPVDRQQALSVLERKIAAPLGMSVEEAAYGILTIAVASMSRAIRSISIEHGYNLGDFTLVSFGGAGPLHSADVARECGIKRVLIPQEPGTMCARGILLSNISRDFVRTELMLVEASTWNRLKVLLRDMIEEGDKWLAREAVDLSHRRFDLIVEARYRGQNHEIRIPVASVENADMESFIADFHAAHKREYGSVVKTRPVEIVNCRVRASGAVPKASLDPVERGGSVDKALIEVREVYYGPKDGWRKTSVFAREKLPLKEVISGPAIIEEMSSTTVVLPGQSVHVDAIGNLIVEC